MKSYSASDEEALHSRSLLKDWFAEGFLSAAQYERMEQETACDLRRTNIFLRVVLFLFTLIIVAAAAGLFFVVFLSHPSSQITGVFLLIFAAVSYLAAEFAVAKAHLYSYGIEEALASCSVGFFSVGLHLAFDTDVMVFAAGTLASLWIWRRFGLPYAFLAAMVFVIFLPGYWTSSHSAQHLILAAIYAAGLITVAALRSREYSYVETLLWLGIYLAINLQLSSLNLLGQWWGGPPGPVEFPRQFYWATWVLTWCLPPAILTRGIRRKDRFVIAGGAILAILTLVTNKPYLGWKRNTWDPMLLGGLLVGVALFIRRWLAAGPAGIRHGFTAQHLSGKEKQWMSAGSAVLGLLTPQAHAPAASPEVRFGGGDSGGGGASSDF